MRDQKTATAQEQAVSNKATICPIIYTNDGGTEYQVGQAFYFGYQDAYSCVFTHTPPLSDKGILSLLHDGNKGRSYHLVNSFYEYDQDTKKGKHTNNIIQGVTLKPSNEKYMQLSEIPPIPMPMKASDGKQIWSIQFFPKAPKKVLQTKIKVASSKSGKKRTK